MRELYIGINGEVTCLKHAGYSLKAQATAKPNVKIIRTDNNEWERMTAAQLIGYQITCEKCLFEH